MIRRWLVAKLVERMNSCLPQMYSKMTHTGFLRMVFA